MPCSMLARLPLLVAVYHLQQILATASGVRTDLAGLLFCAKRIVSSPTLRGSDFGTRELGSLEQPRLWVSWQMSFVF